MGVRSVQGECSSAVTVGYSKNGKAAEAALTSCEIMGRHEAYPLEPTGYSMRVYQGRRWKFVAGDPRLGGMGDGSPPVRSRGEAPVGSLGDAGGRSPPEAEELFEK